MGQAFTIEGLILLGEDVREQKLADFELARGLRGLPLDLQEGDELPHVLDGEPLESRASSGLEQRFGIPSR